MSQDTEKIQKARVVYKEAKEKAAEDFKKAIKPAKDALEAAKSEVFVVGAARAAVEHAEEDLAKSIADKKEETTIDAAKVVVDKTKADLVKAEKVYEQQIS